MKVSELRIGSIMNAEDETLHMATPCVIITLTERECAWRSIHPSTKGYEQRDNIGDMEGIDLDEEWLLKFGFDKVTNTMYRKANADLSMAFQIAFTGNGYNAPIFLGRTIKYVHQLQNLYHALTGEALGAD